MDKAALAELRGRVEAATGPDAELNTDIAEAVGEKGTGLYWQARRYTHSLEEAVALVERLFPGHGWNVYAAGTPVHAERYWARILGIKSPKMRRKPTPALALCLALLKALEAKA